MPEEIQVTEFQIAPETTRDYEQWSKLLVEARANVGPGQRVEPGGYRTATPGDIKAFTIATGPTEPRGLLIVSSLEVEGGVGLGLIYVRDDYPEGRPPRITAKIQGLIAEKELAIVIGKNPGSLAATETTARVLQGAREGAETRFLRIEGGPETADAQLVISMTRAGALRITNSGGKEVFEVDRIVATGVGRWLTGIMEEQLRRPKSRLTAG